MPLVVSTLASELKTIFESMPTDGALAASKLAGAYDKYCKAALAGGIPPVFTGAEKPALEGFLAGVLASGAGSAAQVAQAWSTGIQAYWVAPPVPFMAPPIAGVVTAMPGAASAVSTITGVLSNMANTEDSAAQGLAAALDVATKTVLVTFTTPPPPAGPPPPATVV